MNKREALTKAIKKITLSGYDSIMLTRTEDGWDAWSAVNDVFPDYVGWSHSDGFEMPEVTDHTPMFDPAEYLDQVSQFLYHMPELEAWLNDDTDDAIALAWTPVEDTSMTYDEEEGLYVDEDGELADDNIVGHMYGMIRYSA